MYVLKLNYGLSMRLFSENLEVQIEEESCFVFWFIKLSMFLRFFAK